MVKINKTKELQKIADEIQKIVEGLPQNDAFKKNLYGFNIYVENGFLNIRYISYRGLSKINLEVAKKWLELFRERPQKHFEAERIIETVKKNLKKDQIDKSDSYWFLDTDMVQLFEIKIVSQTKKNIKVFFINHPYYVEKVFGIDAINMTIFPDISLANKSYVLRV